MKLTVTIIKGSKEDTYTAKIGTSIGGGQERCKDVPMNIVLKKLGDIIKKAEADGYVGKS